MGRCADNAIGRVAVALLLAVSFAPRDLFAQDAEEDETTKSRSLDVGFGEDEAAEEEAPASEPTLPEGDAEETDRAIEVAPLPEGDAEEAPPHSPRAPETTPTDRESAPVKKSEGGVLVVLMPVEPKDATTAERIGRASTELLADALGLRAASLRALVHPDADAYRARELDAARREIADGILKFEELDLEGAGASLEAAVNRMTAFAADLDEDAQQSLAVGLFAYAATTLFEGQTDLADSLFVALTTFAPKFEPGEGRYPSNVVERFERLKDEMSQRASGGLRVSTNPPGAEVYVDGQFRGTSPLDIDGLIDGYHQVAVQRLGFRPQGTLAPVTADRISNLDLELDLAEGSDVLGKLTPTLVDRPDAALELARSLGVEKLALLELKSRLSGTVVAGLWLDAAGGKVTGRVQEVRVVDDTEVASKSIVDAILALDRSKAVADVPAAEDAGTVAPEVWWAIAGGVALVAGVTATVLIATSGDSGPPSSRLSVLGF